MKPFSELSFTPQWMVRSSWERSEQKLPAIHCLCIRQNLSPERGELLAAVPALQSPGWREKPLENHVWPCGGHQHDADNQATFRSPISLKFELESIRGPIAGVLMLLNTNQNVHTGVGSALRQHQLSAHSTQNGVTTNYANDRICNSSHEISMYPKAQN